MIPLIVQTRVMIKVLEEQKLPAEALLVTSDYLKSVSMRQTKARQSNPYMSLWQHIDCPGFTSEFNTTDTDLIRW